MKDILLILCLQVIYGSIMYKIGHRIGIRKATILFNAIVDDEIKKLEHEMEDAE